MLASWGHCRGLPPAGLQELLLTGVLDDWQALVAVARLAICDAAGTVADGVACVSCRGCGDTAAAAAGLACWLDGAGEFRDKLFSGVVTTEGPELSGDAEAALKDVRVVGVAGALSTDTLLLERNRPQKLSYFSFSSSLRIGNASSCPETGP